MKENKTAKALEMLKKDPTLTVYAAAKAVGITPTTLYAGKARAEKTKHLEKCPCCGSMVPPEQINRDLLK